MKCNNCGEQVLRKSRIPGEGYVIIGKYVLFKSGSLIAACKRCGTKIDIIKGQKPLLLKVDN